jgi:hypothetical protein
VITGKEKRKPAKIEKENLNGKPPIIENVETKLSQPFVFFGKKRREGLERSQK